MRRRSSWRRSTNFDATINPRSRCISSPATNGPRRSSGRPSTRTNRRTSATIRGLVPVPPETLLPEGVTVTTWPPRLSRRRTVRIPRRPGLSIRHPLSRQHSRQRRGRRDAIGRRMGRKRRTGAEVARRGNLRRPPKGRGGRVREGRGHEGSLASGRQRRRALRASDHQALLKTLDHEPSFRDSKDLRFGMGMSALRIDNPQRRDRLLLLNAFAILLLTLLGATDEASVWIANCEPAPSSAASTPCSAKAACSTTSSPTCRRKWLQPLIEQYQDLLARAQRSLTLSASSEK